MSQTAKRAMINKPNQQFQIQKVANNTDISN